jgi:hypothetical protein
MSTKRQPARRYTQEEVTLGLQAMVFYGSAPRASKALREQGNPIPANTLKDWRRRYVDQYERAREDLEARLAAELGEDWVNLGRQAIEAAGDAVAKAQAATKADDSQAASRWAGTAQKLAIASGIADDKWTRAAGRPTSIREERPLQEVMRALHEKFSNVVTVNPLFIEGEAAELADDD